MRVQRAFAFTDICGFTAFTHRHGDEAAREVLTTFRSSLRRLADSHGVRVAKWLGDGAMLVSVDASALVACLVALHGETAERMELGIRTGVTIGNVMVFEGDDYIGTTVNLAARLCELAEDGEILAHAVVAGRLGSALDAAPSTSRDVRSIQDRIDVVRVYGLRRPERDKLTV